LICFYLAVFSSSAAAAAAAATATLQSSMRAFKVSLGLAKKLLASVKRFTGAVRSLAAWPLGKLARRVPLKWTMPLGRDTNCGPILSIVAKIVAQRRNFAATLFGFNPVSTCCTSLELTLHDSSGSERANLGQSARRAECGEKSKR